MNRIKYVFFILIILTVTSILFLLNSTKMTQWVVDTYAPQYGFGYKQISGAFLTGLEIEGLTFKDARLLDNLKVGLNPAAILYNKVSITHLDANGLNVRNIKKAIEAFVPAEPKEENTRSFILPVSIGVGELHLSAKPFEESGVGFKNISLDGNGIVYYGEGINIDDLSLSIDTNVTAIELSGGIQDKKIRIQELRILDIDTIALQDVIEKMIAIKIHEEIIEVVEPEVEQYKEGKDNFIPKSVQVDSAIVTVKPAEHPQLKLKKGELHATSVEVDIYDIIDLQPDPVQVELLSLVVDTNLTRFAMKSKLKDEVITVDSLSLHDIDTATFLNLSRSIAIHQQETLETNRTVTPLVPKFLHVKHMDTSIKSVTYDTVSVRSTEVNATDVKFNINTLTVESGEIDIDAISSFASVVQHGIIKNNYLESKGDITLRQALFKTYDLPLNEDYFVNIPLHITFDGERTAIDLHIKAEELLESKEGKFNIEHLSLQNHITYLIPEGKLTLESEGNVSTPYAKDIYLENVLSFENSVLDYKGKIIPGRFEGLDDNYTKPLNDLKITYQGDDKGIEADIDSKDLEGRFISNGFKKGDLTLSTKQPFELKNFISLPHELNASKAAVDIHVPLDFSDIFSFNANAKIRSNLATVDADIVYDNELKVMSKTIFPEDSLLRTFSPKLNLDALSPLESDMTIFEKSLHIDVRSEGLRSKIAFNTEDKNLEGNMVLGGAEFIFKGNVEKELSLGNSVSSLKGLLKKASTIYAFEVPPLDGDAKVSLILNDMKDLELKFNSNTLTYKADSKTEYIFRDTMISLGFSDSVLALNKYHTTFQEYKIFATKPSVITFKEGNIEIDPLWVNDELKVTGKYNIENQKGEILAVSDAFSLSHEKSNLTKRVDIITKIKEGKTDLEGTITILDGNIYHEMEIKKFSPDSDIINVQELKKKEKTPFMENLSTFIQVNTEKPLIYKTVEADVKANADLMIQKAYKEPIRVLGTIKILDGSSYTISNKKFLFRDSTINLIGDPHNPFLDITAVYKTRQSEIMIQLAGDLHNPNITFSSIPYMSRKRILSTILFDVQDNTENMSEENMLLMMGDKMSRSLFTNIGGETIRYVFSTIGINIDKIPFIGRSWDANQSKNGLFSFFSSGDEVVIPSHEIHFKGQKYISKKELQKAMGVDTKSVFAFWKEDKPTINDRFLPTLERSLQNFYISEGFYDTEFSIETSKTDVVVSINENEPVKVQDININSDYDISNLVTFKKGQTFRSKEFISIKRNIINHLMKEGYCSYDLESKAFVDTLSHEVDVHFKLKKGEVCTFGELTIKGLETIDDSVIISRVRTREGEPFSTKQIQKTHDALYGLNVFDHILVKHDQKFYNVVPIEIVASEVERPWYFNGGVEYTSSDGFLILAGVKRTNFMGNAKNISLDFRYSKREEGAELSYFVPALFKVSDYYFDFLSKIGLSEFQYEGFTEEKTYVEMLLGYNDEKWSINAGLALENIDISPYDYLGLQAVEAGDFSPVYPFLNFNYDSRDSKIYPKYGYYIGGEIEYGLPYDEENAYLKYSLEGKAIYTFSDITLSAIAKAGIVDHNDKKIAESKLFFAGGFDSNRAYGYKEIGVITSPTSYTIEGGSTMANLSLEASYPISKNLFAEIFTDNTMLTKDDYDFSGDIISSIGVGTGYRTMLGQIRLDVGMNVEDHSQYEINLYIGQAF